MSEKKIPLVGYPDIRRISQQGQICIPKEKLDRLGWKKGQYVRFVMRGGKLILIPIDAYIVETTK